MTTSIKQYKKMMMVIGLSFIIFHLSCSHAVAQSFGYLSYDQALKSMPEYVIVQKKLADLTAQYEAETKRVEDEFNTKYEQFLEGQRDFPPTILQKRQSELEELMEKNIAFKEESRQLLATAEKESMAPLHEKLAAAIQQVGTSRGLAFILNTDLNAVPFINPSMGIDVTEAVLQLIEN
jgi:outer membrane protein